jgi:hypothetical protein
MVTRETHGWKKRKRYICRNWRDGSRYCPIFAIAGYEVTVVDVSDEILREAKEKISWSLGRLRAQGNKSAAACERAPSFEVCICFAFSCVARRSKRARHSLNGLWENSTSIQV